MSFGCVSQTVDVTPPPATVRTATLDELVERFSAASSSDSLKSTVLMELSVLNDDRDKKRQFTEVKGAVVGRKPGGIRVVAQVPVTGQRAFDMASDGETFRVYLPWKHLVYEGENALDARSEKREQNIRPTHVLEPLLIEAPREDETPVLLNRREGRTSYQILQLLRARPDGGLWVSRTAWYNRADLTLSRLQILTPEGDVATIARYQEWVETDKGLRPSVVMVDRPLDGYDLSIRLLTPKWDAPVEQDAFVLEAPKNVEVVPVGSAVPDKAAAAAR